ncbi:6-phosphofructokinase 1 [Thermanaeromonas toyohensis ToBE]|uniref:Pyrophosphate--fructose 6-phosphate 1-phosphotransferase n=1 Tax=Thermanaeromonas toyohensis ToBE TaxID=698762 RepID=A0A1W1VCF5_9FIRM|nr:6-phosphofructokinase [Thermanaeromonas toyohensis]SMB90860.1 6-phosphofructokinase 1 [Thermanaeromonas toyohensis ToBE]
MVLKGNCVIAQSGGPTPVINNSLYGLIEEAWKKEEIAALYGALYGITGLLKERLIDLKKEDIAVLKGLRYTPGAALGSCRHRLKAEEYPRLLEIFKRHNIRYFFYIGGNDSMDTVYKINRLAQEEGYEMRVVGVPKTIDNDLPGTDHCPGYGSAAKYIASVVRETGLDLKGMLSQNRVTLLETMGRNTGWLAAAAMLAKRSPEEAPHLIYLPERPFNIDKFLSDVKVVYQEYGYAYVVVAEGLKDINGNYIVAEESKDVFGHRQLGSGLAAYLKNAIEGSLPVKARYIVPSTAQRSSMLYASRTDAEEAYLVGKEAVSLACQGLSGIMVTLEREKGSPYLCRVGYIDVAQVANQEKSVPLEWITPEGNFLTRDFIEYALPLIQGEIQVPFAGGLPDYAKLNVERK